MKTTKQGRKFISAHEGNPLTAYLDPVNIPTIGHGFTMRSPQVKRELAKINITKLIPGKTKITATQSDNIFVSVLEKEFEPIVNLQMPKNRIVKQNMFDAMVSATWNLGPKFMVWNWIKPWRDDGNVKESARIWSNNYNKAGGRKFAGLVRRRKEEALLFEKSVYTGVKEVLLGIEIKETLVNVVTKEAQTALKKLGFDVTVDGLYDNKTKAAVLKYQKQHPHLKNDSVLGPATMAQLRRDSFVVRDVVQETIGVSLPSGAAAFMAGLPWGWVVFSVATIVALFFAWRYRDIVKRRWNKLTGKEVVV